MVGLAGRDPARGDDKVVLCRRGGDEYGELVGLLNLADIAYSVGAVGEAVARGRELVARARACGRESIIDNGFVNFGAALADCGATAEAAQAFRDGLRLLARNAASRSSHRAPRSAIQDTASVSGRGEIW